MIHFVHTKQSHLYVKGCFHTWIEHRSKTTKRFPVGSVCLNIQYVNTASTPRTKQTKKTKRSLVTMDSMALHFYVLLYLRNTVQQSAEPFFFIHSLMIFINFSFCVWYSVQGPKYQCGISPPRR